MVGHNNCCLLFHACDWTYVNLSFLCVQICIWPQPLATVEIWQFQFICSWFWMNFLLHIEYHSFSEKLCCSFWKAWSSVSSWCVPLHCWMLTSLPSTNQISEYVVMQVPVSWRLWESVMGRSCNQKWITRLCVATTCTCSVFDWSRYIKFIHHMFFFFYVRTCAIGRQKV